MELPSIGRAQDRKSTVESVEILVSDCSHCGMSPLGQIHVKVTRDDMNPF